tara:strand:+ start:547 stop:894 length:348 start_codon:yes stop_codon:yes gene_type:complete
VNLERTEQLVTGVGLVIGEEACDGNAAARQLVADARSRLPERAQPQWMTLALTLPTPDPQWLDSFSRALAEIAAEDNLILIGGDTTRGPHSLALYLHATVPDAAPGEAREGRQPS